jgi:hypothetical protein
MLQRTRAAIALPGQVRAMKTEGLSNPKQGRFGALLKRVVSEYRVERTKSGSQARCAQVSVPSALVC